MPLLGLIGNPLSHSRSPELFGEIFRRESLKNWNYNLFPLSNIKLLPELIAAHPELCGFNVTIPYKTDIIPFLDQISIEAEEIGAVNTVRIERNKNNITLIGYNTDAYGFEELLKFACAENAERALVLGSGGAAKAVCYVLEKFNITYSIASRNSMEGHILYGNLDEKIIKTHNLIINTTPLGMHPNIDECPPIPFDFISQNHTIIDLVYNPENTSLMKKVTNLGSKAFNGMLMLQKQAEKAWEIFNK